MKVRNTVQEEVIKTILKKKEIQKGKNGYLRRSYKWLRKEKKLKAREKSKYILSECRAPKNRKER